MIGDKLTAWIRTAVPILAGWLISQPVAAPVLAWLGLDTATADRWVQTALTALIGALYYTLVRFLEEQWPQLGVLLGVPAKPTYGASPAESAPSLADVPDTPDPLAG